MYYQVVSFSHKSCDQGMREKLAFANDEEKREMLNQLTTFEFVYEAFIVSTCNRVEIVLATRDNFSKSLFLRSLKRKSSFPYFCKTS